MINPGTKYVTIGGAIANDIHGKAHHVDGSFANCVQSFTILLAEGSVVHASRDENTDLFWANFGGLGLLGSILTATIRLRKIETTYFKQKAIKVNNLDELLDAIDEYDQQYDYSVAWVDSLATGKRLGRGVLTTGNAAKLADLPAKLAKNPLYTTPNPRLNLPFYVPGFALNTFTVSVLNKILETVQSGAGDFAHYEKFFFPLDAINNWNRGYGKNGFIQYQFVVPEEGGRKSISDILKVIAESGNSPFLNVLKKFGEGQSESMLSFPMKGYTFAIDFPVRKGLRDLTATLDQMVVDRGGRIYLGKDAMLKDHNLFKKMYPRWEEWVKIKQTYDPNDKFSSNLSRRLKLENLGA
jgi:FAD/FMN-containing dehydrogenase